MGIILSKTTKICLASVLIIIIIGIATFFLVFNRSITGYATSSGPDGYKIVTKIIDGDTVIVEGGYTIRLLGMDSDEKGYPCYETAKERLEELVLGEEVYLESDNENQDIYERYLRYLILDGDTVNTRMVREGFAVARSSPENTKYQNEIAAAEREAIQSKTGCKWSGESQLSDYTTILPDENATWTEFVGNAINVCDATDYIGENKIFEGRVVDSYKASKSNTVFLNFGKPYPNHCFTAVIFSSDMKNFPENPQDYYVDKTVRIKGIVKIYEGKPEIILENEYQIEIG
ncbi:MAG: thermonuclease family protein [Candidatus Aenigmatarchaeota archaeon]